MIKDTEDVLYYSSVIDFIFMPLFPSYSFRLKKIWSSYKHISATLFVQALGNDHHFIILNCLFQKNCCNDLQTPAIVILGILSEICLENSSRGFRIPWKNMLFLLIVCSVPIVENPSLYSIVSFFEQTSTPHQC